MSFLSLRKKLQPAKKAWKGFTSTLQTNLPKLKRSKAIKKATKWLATFSKFLTHKCRSLLHLPHKTRLPFTPHATYNQRHLHRSFPAVYVEELFNEPASVPVKFIESHAGKEKGKGAVIATETDGEGPSKAGELPTWGVDERADKFISIFHEEMRLQRERSLEEYQQMLARGAM